MNVNEIGFSSPTTLMRVSSVENACMDGWNSKDWTLSISEYNK